MIRKLTNFNTSFFVEKCKCKETIIKVLSSKVLVRNVRLKPTGNKEPQPRGVRSVFFNPGFVESTGSTDSILGSLKMPLLVLF